MKLFAIGDIHGCIDELKEMLEIVDSRAKPGDQIAFVGDYTDRGPDSCGVVDLLMERERDHPIEHHFCLGNHEDMLLSNDPRDVLGWALGYGKATVDSYGQDPYTWKCPADHYAWYKKLKYFHQCGRIVVVHAGLDPTKMLPAQTENTMIWGRNTVGYRGIYLGGYYVVYGHTPLDKVIYRENQAGIDTACVFGGALTCLEMEQTGLGMEIIEHTVKAKKKYYG